MTFAKIAGLTIAIAAATAATSTADAAVRTSMSHPTNYCQTALPVFDGNVRKRPVSVQNEGSSNAFVTCSFGIDVVDPQASQGILGADLYFHSDVAGSVTCTGVAGWNGVQGTAVKTLALTGGGQTADPMSFTPADFPDGQMGTGLLSVSCNLAPGVGIDDTYVGFDDGEAAPV